MKLSTWIKCNFIHVAENNTWVHPDGMRYGLYSNDYLNYLIRNKK